MLNRLKDHSLLGMVLFVMILFLGLYLRLSSLAVADFHPIEIKTFYFAHHLDRVFFVDPFTPFYYALCRLWLLVFPENIISLRMLSVFLSLLMAIVIQILVVRQWGKKAGLIMFGFWWLMPLDYHLAYRASSLSLLIEMAVVMVLIWETKQQFKKTHLWGLFCLFQLLGPMAFVLILILGTFDLKAEKMTRDEFRFYLTTSYPVVIYYAVRYLFLGHERTIEGVEMGLGFAMIIGLIFCYKLKPQQVIKFMVVFWVISFLSTPLIFFSHAAESVEKLKEFTLKVPSREVVVCGHEADLDYYFQKPPLDCMNEVLRLQLKRTPFYLLDLDGNRDDLVTFLEKHARLEQNLIVKKSRFLSVSYP